VRAIHEVMIRAQWNKMA